MHDATVVQMGTTQSSFKQVDNFPGNPSTFSAGLACALTSGAALTTTLSAGSLLGVSLGRSGSNTSRVPIVRRGIRVPIQLQAGHTAPVIGAQVTLHATSGKADSSGTAVNAIYASEALSGLDEDGNAVACALIDFPGGL